MSDSDGRFEKGHKRKGAPFGNRNAIKTRLWMDALRRQLAQYSDDQVKMGEALNEIAKVCVRQALAGDADARTEIANRLDGKPKETIEATFSTALASELTDDELLAIARGSGDGDSGAAPSSPESSEVH